MRGQSMRPELACRLSQRPALSVFYLLAVSIWLHYLRVVDPNIVMWGGLTCTPSLICSFCGIKSFNAPGSMLKTAGAGGRRMSGGGECGGSAGPLHGAVQGPVSG